MTGTSGLTRPLCSQYVLIMLSRVAIAAAVLTSPGWVRVALTVRDERKREEAADALAARIVAAIDGEEPPHPDQLRLSL